MRSFFSAIAALCVSSLAAAQTACPSLSYITPVAVQRGHASELTVNCQASSLHGAYKVLIEGAGVTAEVVLDKPIPSPKMEMPAGIKDKPSSVPVVARSIKLKVTAASNAPLGVREFRIATAHGLSTLGLMLVVDDPVIQELPGINTPAKSQPVPVPCVVCGRIEAVENVDYYRIKGRAGQVFTLEVQSARLQDKIHDMQRHADPYLVVIDALGHEIASGDDTYFADPVVSFIVPRDGDYLVAVRDAKFDGDPRWSYALSITDRPYVSHLFPLAVNPGREAKVEPVGSARLLKPTWTFMPPDKPGVHAVSLPYPGGQTNPAPLVVTPLALSTEQEPNDTPAQANRIAVPCGVNGRIGAKRDLDHFVFKGTKGKAIRLEVFARRFGTVLRSQLDSQLDVMTPAGKVLASNDDANGKDSALVFTPPADGDYVVRVRDLNNKGGDGFVYYLEADWARPSFSLKCDPSKAMIGPGARTAWYPIVTRMNGFEGPVKIKVKGLPPGVAVNPLTIPANMTAGLLVLSAEAGAKPDASAVRVVGAAEAKDENGKPVTLTQTAAAVEEIYVPGGGRGRLDVGLQAVAVTGAADILNVKVKPNRIAIKPGQEVKIEVELKRRSDYDKPVSLDVQLRHLGNVFANPLPPGVTLVENKSKTLLGTGSVGHIVLKAAADAPECVDVPICVQAFVPINFVVKVGYASEAVLLSVQKK